MLLRVFPVSILKKLQKQQIQRLRQRSPQRPIRISPRRKKNARSAATARLRLRPPLLPTCRLSRCATPPRLLRPTAPTSPGWCRTTAPTWATGRIGGQMSRKRCGCGRRVDWTRRRSSRTCTPHGNWCGPIRASRARAPLRIRWATTSVACCGSVPHQMSGLTGVTPRNPTDPGVCPMPVLHSYKLQR